MAAQKWKSFGLVWSGVESYAKQSWKLQERRKVRCYCCNQEGHVIRDCPDMLKKIRIGKKEQQLRKRIQLHKAIIVLVSPEKIQWIGIWILELQVIWQEISNFSEVWIHVLKSFKWRMVGKLQSSPNKNESELFVRLAPYFTFVSQNSFSPSESIVCV